VRIIVATQTVRDGGVDLQQEARRQLQRPVLEATIEEVQGVDVVDQLDLRSGIGRELPSRRSLSFDHRQFVALDEVREVDRSDSRSSAQLVCDRRMHACRPDRSERLPEGSEISVPYGKVIAQQ
jgi:hypothetical protein